MKIFEAFSLIPFVAFWRDDMTIVVPVSLTSCAIISHRVKSIVPTSTEGLDLDMGVARRINWCWRLKKPFKGTHGSVLV